MSNPIIGIFTCKKKAGNGSLHEAELAAQNLSYVRSVEENGGLPLLIPYNESAETVRTFTEMCDGLLVPGGIDIDPSLYGESPDIHLGEVDAALDKAELISLQTALSDSMPVFGICRGLQLMNVFCGGTLYQDLPSQFDGELIPHRQTSARSEVSHTAAILPDSRLYSMLGCDIVSVNSLHHQAVKKLGKSLSVSALAEDGVVEGIEHENGSWFAVQWHPEELTYMPEMNALFVRFMALSSDFKERKLR